MKPKTKPKGTVVLTVKCSGCGKCRDIQPGEVHKDDFPMCDVCYMPMMPVKAEAKVLP